MEGSERNAGARRAFIFDLGWSVRKEMIQYRVNSPRKMWHIITRLFVNYYNFLAAKQQNNDTLSLKHPNMDLFELDIPPCDLTH